MRDNEFQRCSNSRTAVLKAVLVTGVTVAACAIGVPTASANTQPICEQVTISGDLTGPLGPFGPCVNNPDDLPVNCVTIPPSVGTLIKVTIVLCTLD